MAVVSSNGKRVVQFGIFEVDLRAGELRRNGSKVRLQEQPFQVLSLLLERPGEVVTREELQKELWPADTFVDFDHSLNAAIRRLRDALGDSAENPRFVETVARRGYRFLAPVNGMASAVSTQSAPRATVRTRHWRIVAAAGAVLLAGMTVGWMVAHWSRTAVEIKQRRLTANSDEAPVLGAAISPDGKYLAFSDNTGLYLQEVGTGETHPLVLPADFKAVPAAWYPDGTHLVATWVEGPKAPSSLWQISIMGGTPRRLIDDGRLASVSPDGSQVVFVRGPKLDEEIWVMQGNGEKPRRLISGERSMFGTPAWSPDGRRIAYVAGTYAPEHFEVTTSMEMFDLSSGRGETIFSPATQQGVLKTEMDQGTQLGPGLAWSHDNRLVYSVSEPPPNEVDSNLWSVALDSRGHLSGTPMRLTATPDPVSYLSATADGKRIAYTKYSLHPGVYVAELTSAGTQLGTPQRLTQDDRRNLPFAWTPDNQAIFLASDRDGSFHIFKQQLGQSVPELFVGGEEQAMAPRLTPDASAVIYVIWPKLGESRTPRRLMRVPLAGGPSQVILSHSGIGNVQCARLPSTLCLYDARTASQLSFFRFDPFTGQSQELPHLRIQDELPYAYNWSLSPDGKTLATAKKEGVQKDPSITLVSIEDGSRQTVTAKAWAGINSIDFAADSRSLWAPVYTNTGQWALLNIDLHGRTRTLLEDTSMAIGWAIPSPDGRQLAFWKARGSANVWLLESN